MDATRKRRTKDQARRSYYASHRQQRFAQHMGFAVLSIPRNGDRGPYALTGAVASRYLSLRAG